MESQPSAASEFEARKRLRAPTMVDVARIAGVSAQTVSRALAGHPNVSEVTRMQVRNAVEESGYRRTGLARALVTGRSKTIGVITHETDFYSRSSILLGIQLAIREHGYFVSTASTSSLDSASIAQAIEQLLDQSVEALVIAVPVEAQVSLEKYAADLPIVIVDGQQVAGGEIIAIDQTLAGRTATEHLLSLGHESVWHIAGPASWNDAAGRTEGWSLALKDAGRMIPPILYGDWGPESGYRNGLVLGRLAEVTAIFVASDEMAFGLIRALNDLGRRVPEDVSVVGMDDIALASYCTPPLTTIRQPFHEVGRQAVENVLRRLSGSSIVHDPQVIEPELVVRQSTTRPPG